MSEKNRVHHVYDGIEEEDNRLPNWWLAILLGTIVFSFGYWFVYETVKALDSPLDAYTKEKQEVAAAQAKLASDAPLDDKLLLAMVNDADTVAAGKKIFASICVSCHASEGQGSVGPNLTDRQWLNVSTPMDIIASVRDGSPEKGMEAWGQRLGPERVKQVAVFVLSIRNTNKPGKAPEGDKVLAE